MRNFKWIIICLIVIPFLQSCLNNDEKWDENTNLALVTVRMKTDAADKNDFFFALDNNETINPLNTPSQYKAIDGQRAFACLKLLDNTSVGYNKEYNYNAEVLYIENILTKDIIPLTSEINDSIGNDRINITHAWIAQNYITIECQFYRSYSSDIKHMLNMVYDAENPVIDENGYLNLEFRHNAYNDANLKINEALVSFKLDNIAELMKQSKGLRISVNTIYNDTQYIILENESDERILKSKPTETYDIF